MPWLLVLLALLGLLGRSRAALVGKGASLPDALYQSAFFAYQFSARHLSGDADAATVSYTATGSSTGKSLIADPTDVTIDFAGSDSLLSAASYAAAPDLRMYPAVAGAVVPIVNLPFLDADEVVVLSRGTLAKIFLGDLRFWNDTSIVDDVRTHGAEAVATKLEASAERICVVVRTDGSGTSEIFTKALARFSSNATDGVNSFEVRVPPSDRPDWCEGDYKDYEAGDFGFRDASADEQTDWGGNSGTVVCTKAAHLALGLGDWSYLRGDKNDGVSAVVSQVVGAIGYSVLNEAIETGLAFASIVNAAGRPVAASADSVNYALMELGGDLDKFNNADLFDAAGVLAWPIAGFTYFVMRSEDASRSCRDREEMVRFFEWFYRANAVKTLAADLGFGTLPAFIADRILDEMVAATKCFEDEIGSSAVPSLGHCCDASLVEAATVFSWCPACSNGGRVAYDSYVAVGVKIAGSPALTGLMATFISAYAIVDPNRNYEYRAASLSDAFDFYADGSAPIASFSTLGVDATKFASLVNGAPESVALPFALSGVLVAYHIPANTNATYTDVDLLGDVQDRTLLVQGKLQDIALTGEILAKIYLGAITFWDDAELVAVASDPACAGCGNADLPHEPIHVVLRSDASDATEAFTTFLTSSSAPWAAAHGVVRSLSGVDTSVYASFSWATSDTQIEAAVNYQLNSVAYFHFLRASTTVDAASLLANGELLALNKASLQACETEATKVTLDEFSFFYDATSPQPNPTGCWPLTVAYALVTRRAFSATTADPTCAEETKDVGMSHWFFESEEIISPVERINAAGATEATRAATLTHLNRAVTCADDAGRLSRVYEPCGAGRYLDAATAGCLNCPEGTYKEAFTHDFLACQACPEGSFQPGVGATSADACTAIPKEDGDFLTDSIRGVGVTLFAISLVTALVCAMWAFIYRNRKSVKYAQPEFLYLIALGCAIATSTIVPLGVDDQETSEAAVDLACMTQPWLYAMGFAITYAALFAKLERVKRIFNSANKLQRVNDATVMDLLKQVVAFLAVTVLVLVAWTVLDPLRWEREVTERDTFDHPLKSRGSCDHGDAWIYGILILLMQAACLVYGNYVAYITRNAPSEFQESRWIAISMAFSIQVLMLGVPVMVLAADNAVTNYFVRSGILFFQYMSVLVFLFFPKMLVVLHGEDLSTGSDTANSSQFIMTNSGPGSGSLRKTIPGRGGMPMRSSASEHSLRSSGHRSSGSERKGDGLIPSSEASGQGSRGGHRSRPPSSLKQLIDASIDVDDGDDDDDGGGNDGGVV